MSDFIKTVFMGVGMGVMGAWAGQIVLALVRVAACP